MNLLYKAKSAAERGTAYHIRNKFGHRSVKKNVMEAVEHVQNLLNFMTNGYILLLALNLLDSSSLSDVPSDTDITKLSNDIVDLVCPSIDQESIDAVWDEVNDPVNDDDKESGQTEDVNDQRYCVCQTWFDVDGKSKFNHFSFFYNTG